jgi:hypothetical protein
LTFNTVAFFAAAKKVGAAPHRGEANRPLRMQGKANTAGKQPNAAGKPKAISQTNKPATRQTKKPQTSRAANG